MGIDISSIMLLQSFRNLFFDFLSVFFGYLFSTIVLAIFSIVLLMYFFVKKYLKAGIIALAIAVTAVILKVLKELFLRPRPEYSLNLPGLPYSAYSFPSGHTAAAFLLAVMLSRYYPRYKYVFWTMAFLTAFSRIYMGLHYLSDVVASIVIGICIAKLFIYKEKELFGLGNKILKLVHSS